MGFIKSQNVASKFNCKLERSRLALPGRGHRKVSVKHKKGCCGVVVMTIPCTHWLCQGKFRRRVKGARWEGSMCDSLQIRPLSVHLF